MSDKKNFDLEVSIDIATKASPDLKEIRFKAVAGKTEEDLIERHTIGEYKKEEEEEGDEENQPGS